MLQILEHYASKRAEPPLSTAAQNAKLGELKQRTLGGSHENEKSKDGFYDRDAICSVNSHRHPTIFYE